MAKRLPPLRSIEAFVAAARTLSFRRAASELSITKSAVSRRIQALESALGTSLFRRTSRALELTPDGAAYYASTRPAYDALHDAAAVLVRRGERSSLRVTMPLSFASDWLIPRLPRFYEKCPHIDLNIDTIGYTTGIPGDSVDASLRVAKGAGRSLSWQRLLSIVQYPIVSPAAAARLPLRSVADLAGHTWLHLSTMPDAWADWLAAAGVRGLEPRGELRFDRMSLVVEAARNGLGVAIGIEALCRRDLDRGTLVAPFEQRLEGTRAMYFVCRREDLSRTPVRLLRSWLLDEASR